MRESKMKICQCGCGEEFMSKRKDKKFKNKEHQVKANNERQYTIQQMQQNVNSKTNKNFRILRDMLGGKLEKTVSKEFLRGKGFDLGYVTKHEFINGILTHFVHHFQLTVIKDQVTILKS